MLWFINGENVHIPVKINSNQTCEDIFYKTVIWKDNKNYKQGVMEPWGYYYYNDKPVFAHTCMEKDKKTYFIGEKYEKME